MSYSKKPVRAVGGRLVLDFLNTADWSEDGQVIHEKLATPEDVLTWTNAIGITQSVMAHHAPDLGALREMRGHLRALVLAAMHGDHLQWQVRRALTRLFEGGSQAHLRETITQDLHSVIESSLTGIILTSAKALLFDPREIARIKKCAGPRCGWLFVDESRNGRRRWCSMETCGNRAKARRFHEHKSKPQPDAD
ncbi:MAG: CGNR zinc finger domain-containing protein [Pseudomonadota bacterium]